jgi:uncharacterized protein involved in oxidation of intracellular sulfur
MKFLFILNDPPYGTERTYNGLRLANALKKADPAAEVTIFLMGDAVIGGRRGQRTPEGFYNVERMLRRLVTAGGAVLLCGTCMDARAMTSDELLEGARRGTLDELAQATLAADKVLVF